MNCVEERISREGFEHRLAIPFFALRLCVFA
jgi:hypothetical protein